MLCRFKVSNCCLYIVVKNVFDMFCRLSPRKSVSIYCPCTTSGGRDGDLTNNKVGPRGSAADTQKQFRPILTGRRLCIQRRQVAPNVGRNSSKKVTSKSIVLLWFRFTIFRGVGGEWISLNLEEFRRHFPSYKFKKNRKNYRNCLEFN